MTNRLNVLLSTIPKNTGTVLNVDKKLALEMLTRNKMNRAMNNAKYNEYKLAMNKNEWRMNGETIKFDENGDLIDGQKRLQAFYDSNLETIQFMIVTGLPRQSVFTTIDRGQNRTAANDFEFIGVQNSTLISTMIRNINLFSKQSYGDRGATSRTMHRNDMISFYNINPEKMDKMASMAGSYYKKSGCLMKPGILAALYYLFCEKSETDADDFFTKFVNGTNLELDSPILQLRNKLYRSKSNPKERLTQSEAVKYFIIAWNKYRKNEKAKVLKIPSETTIEIQ
jgi:hypothetical protein